MAQNMELDALQAHLQQTGANWQAGVTSISTLPPQQRRIRLGAVSPPGQPTLQEREQAAQAKHAAAQAQAPGAVAAYPASFDLRDVNGSNYITAIEDQGNCGSCVAFGTTATVEATFQWQQRRAWGVDLSEAQLFYCIAASEGYNCETGWWPSYALDGYKNNGIADAVCFPYTAGDQACHLCANWQSRAIKITGWHTITSTSDMKTWLSTNGPLSACFNVYQDFYYYTSGIYTQHSTAFEGGHCVCVVGYDDSSRCWICKNSWGPNWGEGGFFRIAYGQCGIDAEMWTVEGLAPSNNAAFVSQMVQTRMSDDQTVQVTMRNTGTTTWTAGGNNPYRLGSQNPQDNTIWGLNRVDVPTNVPPGGSITFSFTISNSHPETQDFQWRMVQEGIAWFGDFTPNVPIVKEGPPFNSAAFVSQMVSTRMLDDQTVDVTMRNIGNTTWTAGGSNPYRLGSQNSQDNTIWGLNRVDVPADVPPGGYVTFSFTISNSHLGTRNFQWRMVQEGIAWFGDFTPNVRIVVGKGP